MMRHSGLTFVVFSSVALSVAGHGPGKGEKEVVVREIRDRDKAAILKQVDFDKEYLLLFQWSGSGQDKLLTNIEDGPVVAFRLVPGVTKDRKSHIRLYAVSTKANFRLEPDRSNRLREPTQITSAEELAKALPTGERK
jgi:hypothetical protein